MPNKPRNQLLVIIAFTDSFKIHVFFSQEAVSRAFLFILYFIRNAWNLIGSKHCDCSQITKFLQIWAPQSIELTAKLERIQRLAIRFILNLPYSSTISYNILVYKLKSFTYLRLGRTIGPYLLFQCNTLFCQRRPLCPTWCSQVQMD